MACDCCVSCHHGSWNGLESRGRVEWETHMMNPSWRHYMMPPKLNRKTANLRSELSKVSGSSLLKQEGTPAPRSEFSVKSVERKPKQTASELCNPYVLEGFWALMWWQSIIHWPFKFDARNKNPSRFFSCIHTVAWAGLGSQDLWTLTADIHDDGMVNS